METEILVVGDVHRRWDEVDRRFVEEGDQSMVLFVGDFGEEDVELVGRLAALRCEIGVMFGNHDGWYSMRNGCDRNGVREQLRLVGERSLGYRARSLPEVGVALLGARPFSWGGGWKNMREFYRETYDVSTNIDSADKMVRAAAEVPGLPLVIVGHNGPKGLGEGRDAIYGRDFLEPFIDFGDPDQKLAIERLRSECDRQVAATIAGHMHNRLVGGGERQRIVFADGTLHLNAAVVPRHRRSGGELRRHFMRVRFEGGQPVVAADIWVGDDGAVAATDELWRRVV